MKLITHKDYFQQKQWQQACLHKLVRDEEAKMTDDERTANNQHRAEKLEQLQAKLHERLTTTHYKPLYFRRWLFKRASKKALKVAENYLLDMYVELSDECGRIRFITDQLISEAEWMDTREKRLLLQLMKWADSVWIDTIEESGMRLIQISLTYEVSKLVLNK